MATHPAIVATGLGEPLQIAQFPTQSAQADQVRFRIEWVPSAPLDVFQVDAGLMAKFPQSLGDTAAGTVVEVGPEAKRLRVGDKVFGFFFQNEHQKAMQIFATVPEHLLAKVRDRYRYLSIGLGCAENVLGSKWGLASCCCDGTQ